MSRRLTTCVLAAFYVLQSTWLLHAGVDFLFPRVRAVAAASESCCTSDCGCPDDSKAALNCCCVKHTKAREKAAPARPASSIEEAKCKGVQEALSQAFTQPAVCTFARIGAPIAVGSELPAAPGKPTFTPIADSLEKVPI